MTARRGSATTVRAALTRHGLLLEADAALPSVTTLVAGEPVKGSWWGHAAGKAIFAVFGEVASDPGVVVARLVGGKVTLVHPRLRAALLAVATAGEAWQTRGLSEEASRLLARVRKGGSVAASGDAVRELEARLLARSRQVHTESGAHAKVVTTWERWAEEEGVSGDLPAAPQAKAAFEAVATSWEEETGAVARLPWQEKAPSAGRRAGRRSSTGR